MAIGWINGLPPGAGWRRVAGWWVNPATGERRPIPELALGKPAFGEERDSGFTFENDILAAAAQGVRDVPQTIGKGTAYVAELGAYLGLGDGKVFGTRDEYQELPETGGLSDQIIRLRRDAVEQQRQTRKDAQRTTLSGIDELTGRAADAVGLPQYQQPDYRTSPGATVVGGAIRSLPQTALIAMSGPAAPFVSALVGGASGYDAQEGMLARGMHPDEAMLASSGVALGTAALERLGGLGVAKGGGGLGKRLLVGAASEGATEGAQTGLELGVRKATGGQVEDALGQIGIAAATGALAGGPLSVVLEGRAPKASQESGALRDQLDSLSAVINRKGRRLDQVADRIASAGDVEVVATQDRETARKVARQLQIPDDLVFEHEGRAVVALPKAHAPAFEAALDAVYMQPREASEGYIETPSGERVSSPVPSVVRAGDVESALALLKASPVRQAPIAEPVQLTGTAGAVARGGDALGKLVSRGADPASLRAQAGAAIAQGAARVAPVFTSTLEGQRGGLVLPFTPPPRAAPGMAPLAQPYRPTTFQEWALREQGLPSYMHSALERSEWKMDADQLEAGLIASDYKRALDAGPIEGRSVAEVNSMARRYLQGEDIDLPDAVRAPLDAARTKLDSMSEELIASGLLSREAAEEYRNNLGSYLYRAYYKHIDPEFAEHIYGTPVYDTAVRHVMASEETGLQERITRYREQAQRASTEAQEWANQPAIQERLIRRAQRYTSLAASAESRLAALSAPEAQAARRTAAEGFVQNLVIHEDGRQVNVRGRFAGLAREWMSKRKNIPPEIRAVMGQADDPMTGFLVVSERSARTLAMNQLWEEVDAGLGVDIFETPQPGAAHPIKGTPPGRERYTSKRLAEVIEAASTEAHQNGFVSGINALLKANATVFSLQSHMRNVASQVFPLLANGNVPGFAQASSGVALKSALVSAPGLAGSPFANDAAVRDFAIDAVKHGVSGTSVDVGDLKRYLAGVQGRNPVTSAISKATSTAGDYYAMGDNAGKAYAWHRERLRYAQALGKSYNDPEVKERSAEVVRRTMQNYQRLPKWAEKVRESPVIGPFVSFPVASLQNVAGVAETIRDDIRDGRATGNKALIEAGIMRGITASATLAGLYSATTVAASAIGLAAKLAGQPVDQPDEEDEEAVRRLVPKWLRPAQFVVLGKPANGMARVLDISYLNYYNSLLDPIQEAMRGDDPAESSWRGFKSLAGKVFGEELALSAYSDLTRAPENGAPIVDPEMSGEVAYWRVARYAMGNLAPGTARSIWKIAQAEPGWDRQTETWSLFGPRQYSIDARAAAAQNFYTYGKSRRALSAAISAPQRWTTEIALAELEANVQNYQDSAKGIHQKAIEDYQAMLRLGVPEAEAREIFTAAMGPPGRRGLAVFAASKNPEASASAAARLDWDRQQATVIKGINAAATAKIEGWKKRNPTAPFAEAERQRQNVLAWQRKALAIVKGAAGGN